MQYTEVQVRPAGGGADAPPLTFRKLCETPSVEDVYEDRFVSVTYTKKYAASEVFLRAPLPDDATLGGLTLNVSRASSSSAPPPPFRALSSSLPDNLDLRTLPRLYSDGIMRACVAFKTPNVTGRPP